MPVQVQRTSNDTFEMRLSGLVLLSEFGKAQEKLSPAIGAGAKPRVLAVLEDFEGWEHGADWGTLAYLFAGESHEIAKIAIVGDPRWEAEALAFAGAGFRRAPVQFFAAGQEKAARAWLAD